MQRHFDTDIQHVRELLLRRGAMTFINDYFERMADGVTSIAEMVVSLVEGKVLEHQLEQR